jgi:hypothetical protein
MDPVRCDPDPMKPQSALLSFQSQRRVTLRHLDHLLLFVQLPSSLLHELDGVCLTNSDEDGEKRERETTVTPLNDRDRVGLESSYRHPGKSSVSAPPFLPCVPFSHDGQLTDKTVQQPRSLCLPPR